MGQPRHGGRRTSPATPAPAEKIYDGPIAEIKLEPTVIELKDALDAARVLVTGKTPAGEPVDLTRQATVEIVADEKFGPASTIVKRDVDGFFLPAADGQAIARFKVADKTAEATIRVTGMQAPRTISYVRDVMPILSKAGCNSGPCHGTPKENGASSSLCVATTRNGTTNNSSPISPPADSIARARPIAC